MLLMPDPPPPTSTRSSTKPPIVLTCDVVDPTDGRGYDRDPRSIAKRAEAYLKASGHRRHRLLRSGTRILHLRRRRMVGRHVRLLAEDPLRRSGLDLGREERRRRRLRPPSDRQGRLFPRPAGRQPARHPLGHGPDPRVAWACRSKCITTKWPPPASAKSAPCFNTLVKRADWTQILKYVVPGNVAHQYGKTATFMPKPIVGDNGSGMHVHQSIWKDGKNLFAATATPACRKFALFYIGGIIKHAKALNAITNPGTNSYKRLVPHYEAPVKMAYSAKNRSASIRIPHVASDKARRIETRFPDPIANPYLCFAALLMAGLDGIQNKIHPGDPADKNLYDLPPEEDKLIPTVCASLDEALAALDKDRDFLTKGGVFSSDWIDAYIDLKMDEVNKVRMTTHPVEFDMYYSC